jgi:hypothetical protein
MFQQQILVCLFELNSMIFKHYSFSIGLLPDTLIHQVDFPYGTDYKLQVIRILIYFFVVVVVDTMIYLDFNI